MSPTDRRLLSLIYLSAGALVNFGDLSVPGLLLVMLSLGFAAHSLLGRTLGKPLRPLVKTMLAATLAATTLLYNGKFPFAVYTVMCAAVVIAIVVFSVTRNRLARLIAFAVSGAATLGGIIANMRWGSADIDVFGFQQKAAQALLAGHNPYIPVERSPEVISQGVVANLALHFPYGPILPILEAPFRLFGDVRALHVLAAIVTAAAVLVLARRAGTFDLSACVVMAFPLTVGMVLFSWVDIITMAGFATWIVLYRSHPKIATLALAIALGAKPTTVIALVPILFWSVRARRQVLIAALLAALVVLPFAAVTGFYTFYYDVLGIQLAVLPRVDALTINSFLSSIGLPLLPFALSAAVVGITAVLVLWRRPTTYGQLLTASAVLVIVSFLVAKWAYLNYYYIPAVLLMLAVAGADLELDTPEMIRPPVALTWAVERLRRGLRRVPRSRVAREPRPEPG